MKTMLKTALALLALTALSATVRAANVRYDYDESVDFSTWKAWAWKRPAAAEADASLAEARIRRALEAGLAARGYAQAERGEADFLVEMHTAARRDLRLSEDLRPRWRRDVRVDSAPVGVLVVDVFDARTGRLAWRGTVSDDLAGDPEKADKRTEKVVTKLLRKFPPGS